VRTTRRAVARRRRPPQHAPHRAPAARSCPPASRTGRAEPGADALLSSLQLLLKRSVLESEKSRQGVGAGQLLSGIVASVPPDPQPALVPGQPAAHFLRRSRGTSGSWNPRNLLIHAGHQVSPWLPFGQSGFGQLVVTRAA